MFGGVGHYVEALDAVLEFVDSEQPSTDELVEWYRDRFARVSRRDSILRNAGYLRSVGFLESENERWEVGAVGREYRSAGDVETLVRIMCDRNVGLWTVMSSLTDGPMSIGEINRQQLDTHDELGWDPSDTTMAVQRTNWLLSMEMIRRDGNEYAITEAGRSFVEEREPPAGAPGAIESNRSDEGEDIEVAGPPPDAGGPPRAALTAELQELEQELDRPVRPTDLARHGSLAAEEYTEQFGSWERAGEVAQIPVSDPTWKRAVLEELRLYRDSHHEPTARLDDLYVAMEDRLGLLFPNNNNVRPKIRQQLQYLRDDGEIEFTDNAGEYESLPSGESASGDSEEPPETEDDSMPREQSEVVSELESACVSLERAVRSDADSAGEKLRELQRRVAEFRDRVEVDTLPADVRRRVDFVERRTAIAEASLEAPDEAEETVEDSEQLLEDLQELAEAFGESPSREVVAACGRHSVESYDRQFGSWPEALEAAGLDPIDHSKREQRHFPRSEVLAAIRELVEELGRMPSQTELDARGGVSRTTIVNLLGGWETTQELAGRLVDGDLQMEDSDDVDTDETTEGEEAEEPTGDEEAEETAEDDDGEPTTDSESDAEETSGSEPDTEEEDSDDSTAGTEPEVDEFGTVSSIEGGRRLEEPVAIEVLDVDDGVGSKRDQTVVFEDSEGKRAELTVWEEHEVDVDWTVGEWYLLEESLGKSYEDDEGETIRNLSSSSDFTVEHTESRPTTDDTDESRTDRRDSPIVEGGGIGEATVPGGQSEQTKDRTHPEPSESPPEEAAPPPEGEFATLETIDVSGPVDRSMAIKILSALGHQGGPKSATLEVEDSEGDQTELTVWRYHASDTEWRLGRWYVVDGIEATAPPDPDERVNYQLASTKDFAVGTPGEGRQTDARSTDERSVSGRSDSDDESDPDESDQGENKMDILSEIASEIENL
jgi:hypothetical protein